MVYLFDKLIIQPNQPIVPSRCDTTIPTTCKDLKSLDLEDFDILLVTSDQPYKLIHINRIDNIIGGYKQIQVEYSLDGKTLASTIIPFDSVRWKQVSENKSNGLSINGSD